MSNMRRKNLSYVLVAVFTLFFCAIQVSPIEAKVIPVEGEGSYKFTPDLDVPAATKEKALLDAKRRAVESEGVYIEVASKVQDGKLVKDEILSRAMGVLKITSEEYRNGIEGNDFVIYCKIKGTIDTDSFKPEQLAAKSDYLEKITAKDKRIAELEAIIKKQQADAANAAAAQKEKAKATLQNSQNQFLIAVYERDIDVYDFNSSTDMKKRLETAQKLIELDPHNPSAYRCLIANWRQNNDLERIVSYSKSVLAQDPPASLAIEAYVQLADVYYNEHNDKKTALDYVNKGIILAKQLYTAKKIDDLVNGGNAQVSHEKLTGRTNAVRDLYVLKSDLDGIAPGFKTISRVEYRNRNWKVFEDRIYDIRYKTDW